MNRARTLAAMRVVASHRSTSNSRGPGQQGTVFVYSVGLATCAKCGGVRMNFGGPHAPRLLAGGLRDCVGDLVGGRS